MATVNVACERKEASADVLHEEGPRTRGRGAQDHREQADGGGSPPPSRGARPEEGKGGEASDREGQGGSSRRQVGRTRPKRAEAKSLRARTEALQGTKRGLGRNAPALLLALIHVPSQLHT